ncbi:MAG: RecQ family ATP-dependent DNA helicase [Prevotellaceae bacterium]|jgi:ATP-dependent DNA helicase RecQ|nr:RecQ family ATP-dependent DNA helicase [Prevotellaceae bacterium]
MDKYRNILLKYWGYPAFRDLQEDIIRSVAQDRKDTLALMPTGGGKSITFQVPAMALDGICIVITPLIALMKDQVENLKNKNIKALMVHSGMTAREIDVALNNAVFGDYKFLYLSPERLQTELFRARLQKMKVSLIAVDESHCISQWGYDFRPSYLQIAETRPLLPDVPVLALTATATQKVAADIMDKLKFAKPNLLQKSFERKNLVYIVREVEDKFAYLINILNRQPGTGVVYVRSRGGTKDWALRLLQYGISADFYHAGLSPEMRSVKQDEWKQGKTRIIVATNAFGMGIDKPDVRIVVHLDLPDSVEAYFQEAGRAGRDGETAYAVLLYSKTDRMKFEQRFRNEFPDLDTIKNVYQAVCNSLQIPYGAGKDSACAFDLNAFAVKYRYFPTTVVSAFKFLQRENVAELTEEIHNPSRLVFLLNRDDLYKVQINNPDIDRFIKTLLRAYAGLFSDYVAIDENLLAKTMFLTRDDIYNMLVRLNRMKIVEYIPQRKSPMLILHEERLDNKNIRISPDNFVAAKKRYAERMNAMIAYAETGDVCRSVQLLAYFGENTDRACGNCDVCRRRIETELTMFEYNVIVKQIMQLLAHSPKTMDEIVSASDTPDKIVKVVRRLLDNGKIKENSNRFFLPEQD